MKWIVNDMDLYIKSKEYVDTAVIPLIPLTWEKELKSTVAMGEFITLISYEIERQFKGRVVLLPPFTYFNGEERKLERLKYWEDELLNNGCKNVFYLTSDVNWRQVEDKLQEELVWLPTLPLEHVDEKYKDTMIKDQINQLVSIFINKWKKE